MEAGLDRPDQDATAAAARQVRDLGCRLADRTLVACGDLGEGRALLRLGRVTDGLRLLDRAMLAVTTGELHPEWAGDLNCHMMAACDELGDLPRARRWTTATEHWLATMPSAVLFTGICRVHRAQLHRMAGDWDRAERDATQVCRDLAGIYHDTVAEAHYLLGEIRRLRGDDPAAEHAYRAAHHLGRDLQPGRSLLRLVQGRRAAAASAVEASLTAESRPLPRAPLCAAQVEIAIAGSDPAAARKASDELADTATVAGPAVGAAQQAAGAVWLAEGQVAEALPVLREARRAWRELDAPYETARVRVLLAAAHRDLGDDETARWELDEAIATFTALGAARDRHTPVGTRTATPHGLTMRETEVIGCLASGATNREIARALVISDKTVARHLANIYDKLGVTSRTAAAAFAFEHDAAARPYPAAPPR